MLTCTHSDLGRLPTDLARSTCSPQSDAAGITASKSTYTHTHIYIYIYIYTNTHTHTYTQTLTQILAVSLLTWRARRAARVLMQPTSRRQSITTGGQAAGAAVVSPGSSSFAAAIACVCVCVCVSMCACVCACLTYLSMNYGLQSPFFKNEFVRHAHTQAHILTHTGSHTHTNSHTQAHLLTHTSTHKHTANFRVCCPIFQWHIRYVCWFAKDTFTKV